MSHFESFPDDINPTAAGNPWNETGILGTCIFCGLDIPESAENFTLQQYVKNSIVYLCSDCETENFAWYEKDVSKRGWKRG